MGTGNIIHDIDTLWFFSNVFSPPLPLPPPPCSDEKIKQSVPLDAEAKSAEMSSVKTPKPVKKAKRAPRYTSKRGYRTNRSHMQFRDSMDLTEFGFSSEDIEWHGEPTLLGPRFYPCVLCKMPPLNDTKAMKNHIRSWASAVANSVNKMKSTNFVQDFSLPF